MADAAKMIVQLTVDELQSMIAGEVAKVAAPTLPRFINTAECAEWLDCTPQAVNQWCRDEGMPFVQLGRERRFEPAQVVGWMRSRGRVIADLIEPVTARHLRAVPKGGR